MPEFEPKAAKREPFNPSILLTGFSGSGKTYSALLMAKGIGGRVVLVDTENKRAKVYAPFFEFDHIDFQPPFTPERCREAMKAALAKNPAVLIFDGATQEWWGKGGILREKDTMPGTNDYVKWGKLTPRHEQWTGMLTVAPKCVYIVTCRGKEKHKLKKNAEGKLEVVPQGVKPVQRDDFAYDFSFGYTILHGSHRVSTIKSIEGAPEPDGPLDSAFGKALADWSMMRGEKAAPRKAPSKPKGGK
jgi:hypothetical protein